MRKQRGVNGRAAQEQGLATAGKSLSEKMHFLRFWNGAYQPHIVGQKKFMGD